MSNILTQIIQFIKNWFPKTSKSDNAMNIIEKPNSNSKPRSKEINGIIVHSMGEYIVDDFSADFLQNIGLSAHYLIKPDGTIVKCVDPDRIAYHAGKSEWRGQEDLNSTFIGIEVLVKGHHTWGSFIEAIKKPETYQQEQYEACAQLCAMLMNDHPDITPENIVRHSEVSGPDVRPDDPKPDPGEGFSMTRLKSKIYRNINAPENS